MSGTVRIEGENLILELHGADRILSFKRSLTIPLKHIASVSTEKVPWVNLDQVRLMGTSIPGVVRDGHYLSDQGWVFYEMHDPDECITLTLNDEEYKKVIFQVPDKGSVATLIRRVIPSAT